MKRILLVAGAVLCLAARDSGRPLLAEGTGTITGIVRIAGPIPALAERVVNKDAAACHHTSLPDRALVATAAGAVQNAVISLSGAALPGGGGAVEPATATLAQAGCDYEPHVQVVPLGAKLTITNSDDLMHNVHAYDEKGATLFNIAQPLKGISNRVTLKEACVVRLVCDSGHGWMRAFIVVSDQPFNAISGADGSFTIERVPAGTHRIALWHEYLGRSEQTVAVKAGEVSRVAFEIRAPAATR